MFSNSFTYLVCDSSESVTYPNTLHSHENAHFLSLLSVFNSFVTLANPLSTTNNKLYPPPSSLLLYSLAPKMAQLRLPTNPAYTELDSVDDYVAWVRPFQSRLTSPHLPNSQFTEAHEILNEYATYNDSQRESTKAYALRFEAMSPSHFEELNTMEQLDYASYASFVRVNIYIEKLLKKVICSMQPSLSIYPRLRWLSLLRYIAAKTWKNLKFCKSEIERNSVADNWAGRERSRETY